MLARMFAVSCRELQGRGPWSQRQSLQAPFLNESLRAHESFPADYFCANDIRPGAGREAPFHVRGHDETQTRRRADALARWQMGRVRLRGCRSRSEHEGFALVDCAGYWRRIAPIEPNAESRGAAALFAGRQMAHLDFESD